MQDKNGNKKQKIGSSRRRTRTISDDELERIRGAAKSLQEKIVVYLIIDTGMRRSDIARLKIENINWKKAWLEITQKKTKKLAYPQVDKNLLSWLETYIYDHRGGKKKGLLFPSPRKKGKPLSAKQIYNIFKRVSDRAGVEDVTPHDLRATKITSLIMDDYPDKAVADEMGVSLRTTKRHYEKYSPEDLKKLHDKKDEERKRR